MCLCQLAKKEAIEANPKLGIEVECKICEGTGMLTSEQFYKILKANLGSPVNTCEFDKEWTRNAYAQVVWKLATY